MIKFIVNLIKQRQQFFKYCVGGGIAFIVDFSILYFLTEVVHIWYLWSAGLSFIVAAFVNYLIQRFWTFKSTEPKAGRQFFTFLVVQIIGLFINMIIMYALVEDFVIWYIFSKIIATAIVLIWNFWASYKFVFNKKFITSTSEIIIVDEIIASHTDILSTYSHRIADYFVNNDYKATIIYYVIKNKSAQVKLPYKTTSISNKLDPFIKYFFYFIKLLNISISAKVIYAQGAVIAGLPALLVSKLLGKRLVVKISDDYCWHQAQIYQVTKKNIDDWQRHPQFNNINILLNFKLYLINVIQHLVVKHANHIVVPSYYLKKVVIGWGVKPHAVKVIYNSVQFKKIKNNSKSQAQKLINISGDIILTGGQLVPWKGFDTLVELMPQFKKINPKFKLVIFGDGPEKNLLKKLINKYKLSQDVYLIGAIPHLQLYQYYQASSLFVLNVCYEGLFYILLNAMYHNLPIIASNAGGNPELIQDDYNGILVDYNSKHQWLAAVKRLWNNADLRARFSANPLVKLDIFNFNHMMSETIKVLFIK